MPRIRTNTAPTTNGSHHGPHAGRTNAVFLSSTADYHSSLLRLDQQLQGPPQLTDVRPSTSSRRQWLPLSHTRKAGPAGSENNGVEPKAGSTSIMTCPKARRKEKKCHNKTISEPPTSPYPQLTQQDLEEFEALPIAVRRKYFSTLERLRFAQSSGILDQNLNQSISRSQNSRRTPHSNPRGASGTVERPTTSPTYRHFTDSVEPLSLAKLPAKIREKYLTREEQLIVAKQLRESVILDAADEAIYKIGRRASRHISPQVYTTPTLSFSTRPSMDSLASGGQLSGSDVTNSSFYDSFRWLDEDDDLDLNLSLHDYQADLKETKPLAVDASPPSSFRRRISLSRKTFGRTSISSSRPPSSPGPSQGLTYPPHARQRSRALSLITPRQSVHDPLASIDPEAAHYQDPEARLKLRVYLASPQKFDEAIEFGFPSDDVRSPGSNNRDAQADAKMHLRGMRSADSETFKTFLEDDQSSTYSEGVSVPDPESPVTPHTPEKDTQVVRPVHHPPADGNLHSHKLSDGYAQAPANSREMTLRMTLTRPDLRACEDQIYARRNGSYQHSRRGSRSLPSRDGPPTSPQYAKDSTKEGMDRIFAEIDQELGVHNSDGNVVKRFWNKVRRS